jgi:hypothetical protein
MVRIRKEHLRTRRKCRLPETREDRRVLVEEPTKHPVARRTLNAQAWQEPELDEPQIPRRAIQAAHPTRPKGLRVQKRPEISNLRLKSIAASGVAKYYLIASIISRTALSSPIKIDREIR